MTKRRGSAKVRGNGQGIVDMSTAVGAPVKSSKPNNKAKHGVRDSGRKKKKKTMTADI